MRSPGMVAYQGYSKNDSTACPWDELDELTKELFESVGKEVVDYYASIMQVEPNVMLDEILGNIRAIREALEKEGG